MTTKIGFILLSRTEHPQPSTRISVMRMLPYLRERGFEPEIAYEPEEEGETPDLSVLAPRLLSERHDIVYFQKVHGRSAEAIARRLSAEGTRTVYGVCDLVKPEMAEATDATITVTDYLKSLYPSSLQSRIHVVHDGIERPEVKKTEWGDGRGSRRRPLKAVLVTSSPLDRLPVLADPPEWLHVTIVGRYAPRNRPLQRLREAWWGVSGAEDRASRRSVIRFLANPRIRRVEWDPDGAYDAMLDADIGIIPFERDPGPKGDDPAAAWKVRSENRLTMKMSIGLPVVATPVPAYEAVIVQGENGFLARTPAEWLDALETLRDPATRRAIGERARASVSSRFSTDEQARRLIEILRGLSPSAS